MELFTDNLNTASIALCRELLFKGRARKTRGFDCIEIQEPVMIHILNPTDRYINIKVRKHHKVLPFAESLALAAGVNDIELYAAYVPNMVNFSDDGQFQRAGYGPRIRAFSGLGGDYKVTDPDFRKVHSGSPKVADQLRFVIEKLYEDPESRQALITIHDPAKDCFGADGHLLKTKDQPCTRSLHFMMNNGRLDMIVEIRSNDLLWGFQAVNVFNFTFMQEYVAMILGVEVGMYSHIAHNLHFYEDKRELVQAIAMENDGIYFSEFGKFQYNGPTINLPTFDMEVSKLFAYEKALRSKNDVEYSSRYPFFDDWGKVFTYYHTKVKQLFINPYLNKLFNY